MYGLFPFNHILVSARGLEEVYDFSTGVGVGQDRVVRGGHVETT